MASSTCDTSDTCEHSATKKKLIVKEEEAGDHRPRTVLNMSESQSFNYVQGKTDTETNYEICLGVHFALCVNKYIKQYASKRTVSLVNY